MTARARQEHGWTPQADTRDERPREPLPQCVIREARTEDRGFMFANYLSSAHGSFAYRNMPRPAFDHYGSRLLEELLDRCQPLVVERKDSPGELIAFSVSERPLRNLDHIVLHFLYIKYAYRQQRLGAAVIKTLGHDPKRTQLFCTHMTTAWWFVGPKFGAIYNPFYLFPQFHTDKERPE
jgi:hypothetical protein